jgi:hypothetical protein
MPAALDEVAWDALFDQAVPQAMRVADLATVAKGAANVVDIEHKIPPLSALVHLGAGTFEQLGADADSIATFHTTVKENIVVDAVYFCVRDYFAKYPDLRVTVTPEQIREEYGRYKRRLAERAKKERDRQFVTFKDAGTGGRDDEEVEEQEAEDAERGASHEEAFTAPARAPAAPAAAATHIVQRGENLWTIAENHMAAVLGGRPGELVVRSYWKQLVATNRHLLSDPSNPSFVRPGLEIALPDPALDPAPG